MKDYDVILRVRKTLDKAANFLNPSIISFDEYAAKVDINNSPAIFEIARIIQLEKFQAEGNNVYAKCEMI